MNSIDYDSQQRSMKISQSCKERMSHLHLHTDEIRKSNGPLISKAKIGVHNRGEAVLGKSKTHRELTFISPDGLTLAFEGNVDEPELVGALYIELQLVCEKIMVELQYGELEEIFVRSKSGCVTILPIIDKGILACMSTPDINSTLLQINTWKAVNQLNKAM